MNRKGFTLIELIVVLIIIGILSTIAAPMMQGMSKKAIASEAIAALGTIRTAMRTYYVEHTKITDNVADLFPNLSDLNGTYFSNGCYWILGNTPNQGDYIISCCPANSTPPSPKYSQVNTWVGTVDGHIAMDQAGIIYSDIDGLGYQPNAYIPPVEPPLDPP